MRKQLTTVQRNRRNRIIKRIIYGIILAITIPAVYIYCSNYIEDYFYELSSDVSITTKNSSNNKDISKNNNTGIDKEINITNKEDDENIILDNNNEYTSKISDKDIEETTDDNTNNDTNNNDNNISDRFSSFEPSISTDKVETENTNTTLSVPKEIEDEYLANKSNISQSALEEINKNNEEIAKIEQQREELDAIKSKYEAKVSEIESWYVEEFNKNYDLMIEAKNNYEELGGYATEEDKVKAFKDIHNAGVEISNCGVSSLGSIKSLEEKYDLVCKRYAYSLQYDKYYEYIYTTLPAEKNNKLSVALQEYNDELENYENKYGL